MLVVGFLEVEAGGWLWSPPAFSFIHLLTLPGIHFSAWGSGILPFLYIHLFISLFEQIIVFQAGVRRNTLAWNNRTGPCIHHLNSSLFVGSKDTDMVNRDSNFQGRH